MTRSRVEPFFLDSSAGRIFLLLRAPIGAERCVLFVPPFAEEMNKCRRQVTETAEMLVRSGCAVLVVDLFGTGDSEGEFAEATWDAWKSDIGTALAWAEKEGVSIDSLIATRLGCALAGESLLESHRSVQKSVFWQPVHNGRQFMTQFLRLRVAASMMEADKRETAEGLKERLGGGETLEVAGYELSQTLWRALERVDLSRSLSPALGRLAQFEVGSIRDSGLSVVGRRLADSAEAQGIETTGLRIAGEPFWSTTEIVRSPELTERTVKYLTDDLLT